jgi:hypothetical protein
VFIAFPSWDNSYIKSTIEFAKELSKRWNIIYVNYPFTYKDVWSAKKGLKDFEWERTTRQKDPYLKVADNITILYPPAFIPNHFLSKGFLFNTIAGLNSRRLQKFVTQYLDQNTIHPTAIVNAFNPIVGAFYSKKFLNKHKHVYYCYDEVNAAKWASKHGGYLEKEFISKVDGLIFSSSPLQKNKTPENIPSSLVKNGVDVEAFLQAQNSERFANSPYKAAYIGAIDDRLDYELIELCVQTYPKWTFDFLGSIKDDRFKKLDEKYENINYHGSFPIAQVARILREVHVGLIPFVKNEFTKNIYPLKINEYLFSGMEVVSTNFSDLSDFDDYAYVKDNHKEFVDSLSQSIDKHTVEQTTKQQNFAFNNSWKERSIIFEEAILTMIEK